MDANTDNLFAAVTEGMIEQPVETTMAVTTPAETGESELLAAAAQPIAGLSGAPDIPMTEISAESVVDVVPQTVADAVDAMTDEAQTIAPIISAIESEPPAPAVLADVAEMPSGSIELDFPVARRMDEEIAETETHENAPAEPPVQSTINREAAISEVENIEGAQQEDSHEVVHLETQSEVSSPESAKDISSPEPPIPESPREVSKEEAIWNELLEAHNEHRIVEMRVVRRIKGGLILDYKGFDVFMPHSYWHFRTDFDESEIDGALGKIISVHVREITPFEKRRAVASRKKVALNEMFTGITRNAVLEGTVSGLTSFGVFVKLGAAGTGGIEGLIHISELAPYHVVTPADVVAVGQPIKVRVVRLDKKRGRIWLNASEFLPSKWLGAAEKYPVESIQKGAVTEITKHGMYVQLEQGIVGFVHGSEITWMSRWKDPGTMFHSGDEVEVRVVEISEEKRQLSLSVKRAKENPWEKIVATYQKGTFWEGKIKEIGEKGAVIELPDGTEGFLPRSKMMVKRDEPAPALHAGDVQKLKVIDVDAEERFLIFAIPFQREPRQNGAGGEFRRDDRRPAGEPHREGGNAPRGEHGGGDEPRKDFKRGNDSRRENKHRDDFNRDGDRDSRHSDRRRGGDSHDSRNSRDSRDSWERDVRDDSAGSFTNIGSMISDAVKKKLRAK